MPVLAEIQVHGNLATPEAEILQIAGVAVGAPFDETIPGLVADRLRASGRFDGVEVLKRFASISDLSRITLVIVVDDGPVSLNWYSRGEDGFTVERASRIRRMILPIFDRDDGYGFTYGARVSFAGRRNRSRRVSFPLTWGGHKRAAAEFESVFERGPISRMTVGAALTREENPFYALNDDRRSVYVRGEKRLANPLAAGAFAGYDRISFNGETDGVRRVGVDAVFDTRLDPVLPRNAMYARAKWERVGVDRMGVVRRELDLRGYAGLLGQNVISIRGVREDASRSLPPYLQPLLGGVRNLRGFRAGVEADDTLMAASLEVLMPFTSPLAAGRTGISAFIDVGAVYPAGESVHRQKFERAIGGSVWLSLFVVRMSVAVAHGLGSGTRAHFGVSTAF